MLNIITLARACNTKKPSHPVCHTLYKSSARQTCLLLQRESSEFTVCPCLLVTKPEVHKFQVAVCVKDHIL